MIDALDYLRQLNMASVLLRLTLAMLFGGMIGLDRGRKGRPAGFRTYMLVCLGAALTGIVSQYLWVMVNGPWVEASRLLNKTVDVSRIGAKAIGGVGFLGAGTILVTKRHQVTGLTTAAGLWASAGLGLAIGAGFYECAVMAFVLMLACICALPTLESHLMETARRMDLYIEFTSIDSVGAIIQRLKTLDIQIRDVELEHRKQNASGVPAAVFCLRLGRKLRHEEVLLHVAQLEDIIMIEEL